MSADDEEGGSSRSSGDRPSLRGPSPQPSPAPAGEGAATGSRGHEVALPAASSPGARRRLALAGVVIALAAGALGAWLWLPGLIAQRTLGALVGVVCAPVDVTVAPDLSRAHLGPTECRVPAGPIATFALAQGAEIHLADLRPTLVSVPELALNPREVELSLTAVTVLLTGDTPDPLRRALDAFASASTRTDVPERVRVGEIDLGRGDGVVEARSLDIHHGAGTTDVTLASIGPPPYHGRALDLTIGVNAIEGHATPSTATVEGRFEVSANVLSFPIARSIAFRIGGEHLDRADGDYTTWIEPSAELTWLESHAASILAEIRAAGGVREALHERAETRREERTERIHDLRERLDERVHEASSPEPP
ncbi:MAG: hypothetical protein U0234_07340 [Sandaracinus sp.]